MKCGFCTDDVELGFDFTMAFQPIVDCSQSNIWGYEALVRGLNGESAYSVISQVNDTNRYKFDQLCRVKAITLAAQLNMDCRLSINFLPNAVYEPQRCLMTTLKTAEKTGFPTNRIIFEFTEIEKIEDSEHVKGIIEFYKSAGFITALDDFGAGYSGLGLLADFQTGIVKLDMALIRNIDKDKNRQVIVSNCINMLKKLGIIVLAEGIETKAERDWLRDAGIDLMQGYYFAKPGFECLPKVDSGLI